jgi:putative ATPase
VAAEERLAARGPLASRLRPTSLDDVVGQRHLVGPNGALRLLAQQDRLTSLILWGPPGSGKTTMASLLATTTNKHFVSLSAVVAGVREVRDALDEAKQRIGEHGQGTLLFVDEVHRFNKAQQDVLLPGVESGLITLVGATTENPYFEVNAPLLSRSTLWRLEPLDNDDLATVVQRGLSVEQFDADPEAVQLIASIAAGDARSALTTLEVAIALARGREQARVSTQDVVDARDGVVLHQGEDEHYDQTSALIKSVRGSDPDAALFWLVRLLEAGESPRFLARRMVILASEDIGMADPWALVFAEAASRSVELIGMPEAQLTLAHLVIRLATAPKSNSATTALANAKAAVQAYPGARVPQHLRDGHYGGAKHLGHGEGYRNPHDEPTGWVQQDYLPDELRGRCFYEPSTHGREAEAQNWRLKAMEINSGQDDR